MGKDKEEVALGKMTKELHQIFVWLAKKCLNERPDNVERFCADKLAARIDMRVVDGPPGLSREVSLLEKDNVAEFVKDIRLARPASKAQFLNGGGGGVRKCGYVSSDDDDQDVAGATVDHEDGEDDEDDGASKSEIYVCDNKSLTYDSEELDDEDDVDVTDVDDDDDDDDDDDKVKSVQSSRSSTPASSFTNGTSKHSSKKTKIKNKNSSRNRNNHMHKSTPTRNNRVEFFNRDVFSAAELEAAGTRYENDERMKRLFAAWDGDGSGAIDFVELVIALHKFENVANAGVDIKVAADALLEFVESDTERELKLPQFAKVIVVFARNLFGKTFDDVADHMLKVATSTSEAAMLEAERGKDVSDIVALDKEELELMRETAQCMSVNVENNICKLRRKNTQARPTTQPPTPVSGQQQKHITNNLANDDDDNVTHTVNDVAVTPMHPTTVAFSNDDIVGYESVEKSRNDDKGEKNKPSSTSSTSSTSSSRHKDEENVSSNSNKTSKISKITGM